MHGETLGSWSGAWGKVDRICGLEAGSAAEGQEELGFPSASRVRNDPPTSGQLVWRGAGELGDIRALL